MVGGKPPTTDRELLEILLCQTMAAKPFNPNIMDSVVGRLSREQARTTHIEAAAAMAYAEAATKGTDLVGLMPPPSAVLFVMRKVLPILHFFAS